MSVIANLYIDLVGSICNGVTPVAHIFKFTGYLHKFCFDVSFNTRRYNLHIRPVASLTIENDTSLAVCSTEGLFNVA